MLEHFTHKKVKKHQTENLATAEVKSPVLTEEDESFLERIVSAEGTPPPLPERPQVLSPEVGSPEAGDSTNDDAQAVVYDKLGTKMGESDDKHKGRGKGNIPDKEKKKSKRFSFLRRGSKKTEDGLKANPDVPRKEAVAEEDDINKVLDELNLAAVNNRAFSISKESRVLVQKFTVILKDLVNGVPTAYDDLVKLIEDSHGTLAKSYDHLPSFLQKLIKTLPANLTTTLAPELLAVAAEAQALNTAGGSATAASSGGLAGAAKKLLVPRNLKDLVTKPGAVAGMLKAIMNVLKLRWPAFMGTNVLLSVALFVLLFVFWYCHKRGKEVRLEREAKERMVDSNGRIVELEDDAMLPPSGTGVAAAQPGPIDGPPLRDTGAQNGPASGYASAPVGK